MQKKDARAASDSPLAGLVVRAGHHDRFMCPLEVSIKRDAVGDEAFDRLVEHSDSGLRLLRKDLRDEIPCQVMSHGDAEEAVTVRFVLENLLAGEEEQLLLIPGSSDEEDAADRRGVELVPDDAELRISIDGEYFTSYVYDQDYAKPFLGPVVGPYGHWITRLDHEIREHPHHRSIWVAIGDVNGVDTWNEPSGRYGRQLHRDFVYTKSGPVCGELSANNVWTTFDCDPLVDETRTISIYRTPAWQRIIDFTIVFCASYDRVVFGKTKEAGPLGIRVAESMKVTNGGAIENSIGSISESETWGKRAHWCDYSGIVEGHKLGIAIFDHVDNPEHPTHWHVRDYGLMAPNNFFFTGPVVLKKGESLRYKYRIVTHLGDARAGGVGERYHDYANPPKIEIAEV